MTFCVSVFLSMGHFKPMDKNFYNNDEWFFDLQPPKASKKRPEQLHRLSIWDRNYRTRPKTELREVQNIPRPSLHGKEVIVKKTFQVKRPPAGNFRLQKL